MTILIYLAKMIACSTLLYGYYFFALRNSKYHLYNRIYLLSIPLLSALLPFIKISFAEVAEQSTTNYFNPIKFLGSWEEEVVIYAGELQSSFFISMQNALVIIYVGISGLVLLPFVRSWMAIRALKRNSRSEIYNGVRMFRIADQRAPFSFLNAIFWSENFPIDSEASQKIFHHEHYHLTHKHSIDLLYMIFMQAFFWINPVNYFIRKELESVHEFMADSYAIGQCDKYSYAELLVLTAIENKNLLTHQFLNNQIKRRIKMITTNRINRLDAISKTALFPFILLVFGAFCIRVDAQSVSRQAPDTLTPSELKDISGSDIKSISFDDENVRFRMRNNKEFVTNRKSLNDFMQNMQIDEDKKSGILPAQDKPFAKPQIEAAYPGGTDAWGAHLRKTVKYPREAQKKNIEGTVVLQFIVDLDGSVTNITVLSGPVEGGLREHAVDVLRNSGKWIPAIENGKPVRAYKKQPITFRLR